MQEPTNIWPFNKWTRPSSTLIKAWEPTAGTCDTQLVPYWIPVNVDAGLFAICLLLPVNSEVNFGHVTLTKQHVKKKKVLVTSDWKYCLSQSKILQRVSQVSPYCPVSVKSYMLRHVSWNEVISIIWKIILLGSAGINAQLSSRNITVLPTADVNFC